MKILTFILQDIKTRKARTTLYIIGVFLSLMLVLSMNFFVLRYTQITEGFYRPFKEYDQIITHGSNYFQILPINSRINQSIESEITSTFSIEPIPVLFIRNEESISTYQNHYIMGLRLDDIPKIWEDYGLLSGFWPRTTNEVVVGYDLRNFTEVSIYNHTFSVSGVLHSDKFYSPLASIIVVELSTLQSLSMVGEKVSLFFINSSIENAQALNNIEYGGNSTDPITYFESAHPDLDVVTQNELSYVQQALGDSFKQGGSIVSIISSISSIIFIATMGMVKVYSKKMEISLLKSMGASNLLVMAVIWGEYMFILLLGVVIGAPLSIISYLLIFSILDTSISARSQPFGAVFSDNFNTFIHTVGCWDVLEPILSIIGIGAALSLIPALLSLRVKYLNYLKEKF